MTLTFVSAFFAGLFSFLSPCVLPLVPTYLLYLGGERGRPLFNALFFVGGFGLVFLLLGLPFTLLGNLLAEHKSLLGQVGGVVMILFGAYMFNLFGLKSLFSRGVGLRYQGDTARPWGAFVLGVVLALGWTPCIGPILGGILTLTTVEGRGAELLLIYILGLAVPFLLVALFADRAVALIRRTGHLTKWVERGAGAFLMLVGVLLLSGYYTQLSGFFLKITPSWLLERL